MATNTFARENMLTAARMTHNQEIIDVAEVLNEMNDPIQDAHVQQANDITSHVVSRRTSLPTPSWVKIGNGINASTGNLQQVRETIGMLKSRYQCPLDVMRLQPNPSKFRSQQERAHIEAISQEFVNTLIAGNAATAPEEFTGLETRYSSLSSAADQASGAANASYVLDNSEGNASGSDYTSIWFVQWGPGKVYLVFPRNSNTVGINKEDLGLKLVAGDNASSYTSTTLNQLRAYITDFRYDVGLCIEDMRCVKRLANIDSVSTEDYTLNEDYIIQIRNNFKTPGTIYMYGNETVFTQLQILAKDKGNVHYPPDNPFGKPQMYFQDMPVRRCDGITCTETALT